MQVDMLLKLRNLRYTKEILSTVLGKILGTVWGENIEYSIGENIGYSIRGKY